jgi:hypothetical protein
VDQEILVDAAQRLGVSARVVAQRDEQRPQLRRAVGLHAAYVPRAFGSAGIGDPLMGAGGLKVLLARPYGDSPRAPSRKLNDALYMKTVTAIIRELGQRGNIVILGRGSHLLRANIPPRSTS